MNKNLLRCAALIGALAMLSACSQEEEKVVTFRTVNTKGVTAFSAEKTEKPSLITATAETAPETTVSKETHHYDTTIPETLVGSIEETTVGEEITETSHEEALPEETTSGITVPEEAQPELDDNGYNKVGSNGILVAKLKDGHFWGLMPCWGTLELCESWADGVNAFKSALPELNVYHTVIPTSIEFYLPSQNTGFTASQKKKIDHVSKRLVGVTDIDSYSALEEHKDEPIYSRTDHHWQPLGAYYAAQAFAKEADLPFAPLEDYKKVVKKGYVGSMYNYSEDYHLKNDSEDFVLYIPPNNDELTTYYYNSGFGGEYESELIISPDAEAYYCSFLGSDNRIAKVSTDCKNGRTLVMFKESYGNGMVPFLTSSFETIYVCDIRYFEPNAIDFVKEVGATDIIFAVCTYTAAGYNGNYVSYIINQ